ncbi:hypothetical protein BDN72DRAFT_679723 [Pluteus cervinus]|uniref:Uncharacterized protein n=1 Tax=Pluteus cervinus TaxID=181527 RepID=A0ACD3ARX9_9AGAR|nr:hypothetical protein BDN72DRAFT_679723 [Pluteus cervinus]
MALPPLVSDYQEDDFLSLSSSSYRLETAKPTPMILDLEGIASVKTSWPLWPAQKSLRHNFPKAIQSSGDQNVEERHSDLELLGQRSFRQHSSDSESVDVVPTRPLDGDIRTVATKYPLQYAKVWLDCFECHYALWKKGIFHCDIRDNNLMFKKLPSGELVGFLSDFDLAKDGSSPPFHQTGYGTTEFMACKILSVPGIRPEYWFDVESFFWVAVIDTASYPKGERKSIARHYAEWGLMSNRACRAHKLGWLYDQPSGHQATSSHTQTWGIFQQLLPTIRTWASVGNPAEGAEVLGMDGVYKLVHDVVEKGIKDIEVAGKERKEEVEDDGTK